MMRNFLTKYSGLLKSASVTTLNQVVSSGTNFLLSLYLLTNLSISNFGEYGVLHAMSMVLAGLGNAFFLSQMVVLYPDKGKNKNRFLASVFHCVVVIGFIVQTVLLLSFYIANLFGFMEGYFNSALAVAIFSFSFLIKEYFCRVGFILQKEINALKINSTVSVILITFLLLYAFSGVELTPASILSLYAASIMLSLLLLRPKLEVKIHILNKNTEACFQDVSIGGRWALLNDFLMIGRQQSHVFISAFILGTSATGVINASKMILTPVMLLTPSLSQLVMVKLSNLRNNSPLELFRMGLKFSSLNATLVIIYSLFLFIGFDYIKLFVFTDIDENIETLVVAWSAVAIFTAVRYGFEATQKAMKQFKSIAFLNIPSSVFSIVIIYSLISLLGSLGAVIGLALTELFVAFFLFLMISRLKKKIRFGGACSDSKHL